jgi:TFIIH basal transcription factor complex TTD-A subunit
MNMSGRKKGTKNKSVAGGSDSKTATTRGSSNPNTTKTTLAIGATNNNDTQSAAYLVTCDIPTKQYIQYLNEQEPPDKKFILQDLDTTHLLIELKARDKIERKVEDWLDENIFSAVEKVGEDLDMS